MEIYPESVVGSVYTYNIFGFLTAVHETEQNPLYIRAIPPKELVYLTLSRPLEGCESTIWYLKMPFTKVTVYDGAKISEIHNFRLQSTHNSRSHHINVKCITDIFTVGTKLFRFIVDIYSYRYGKTMI